MTLDATITEHFLAHPPTGMCHAPMPDATKRWATIAYSQKRRGPAGDRFWIIPLAEEWVTSRLSPNFVPEFPYSYGRNNPLIYTDPTGLDITCTGKRCDDYLKALQKDASFKIKYDKNGKVVTEGDIDKKGLSKTDKAMLKAIDDTKHHVTINAIDGGKDPSVFLGRSDAPHSGTHTLAFDQLGLLDSAGNAGGATSAQIVGHETLEGYSESLGNSYDTAHDYANQFFGGLSSLTGGSYRSQGGMVTDITGNFRVSGTSTTESITFHFVTPIPQVDFLAKTGAPYQVYPTDVEKKQ